MNNKTTQETGLYDVRFLFNNESEEYDIVAEITTVIHRKADFYSILHGQVNGEIFINMTLPEILKVNTRFRYSIKEIKGE